MEVVTIKATLQSTMEEFDEKMQTAYKNSLASGVGVPAANIELVISEGSLIVEARIIATEAANLQQISNLAAAAVQAAASSSGITVLAVSAPAVAVVAMAAPPPPSQVGELSSEAIVAIAVVSSLVVVGLIAFATIDACAKAKRAQPTLSPTNLMTPTRQQESTTQPTEKELTQAV